MNKGPLQGIRVVEITMFQQGPIAGAKLGDLGADVIKVEPPTGDPGRQMMKVIGAMCGLSGQDYYFEHCNRNKRSIVLDLKTTSGLQVFYRLIQNADVFLNNMSIDVPERLNIAPNQLMEINPRLIVAHASGWGRKGPDAKTHSFDYTGIARSGLMMSCGENDTPPTQILPGVGVLFGVLFWGWAITADFYEREKTGRGQVVDTSLMGSIICALGLIMAAPSILNQEFPREPRTHAGNPLYNHYCCQDGKWLAIAHLEPDRHWPKLCKALECEELRDDPRFDTVMNRSRNARALVEILDARFANHAREEWLRVLEKEGCIATPIQTPLEVVSDPQALSNQYIIDIGNLDTGCAKRVGFPWSFSDTPASYRTPAPKLGEHTQEIMQELGIGKKEANS